MKTIHGKKRSSAILLALLTALALTGCDSANTSDKNTPAEAQLAEPAGASENSGGEGLFTLRVVNQTQLNELVVADLLGFFEDEGIKIEYIGQLGQGVTQLQALEQGIIDVVTQGHPEGIAKARLAGMEVKMVAPGYVDAEINSHIVYLVKEDSAIQSLDDLVGKKAGIPFSGVCTDGYLRYYLKQKGLDPDSLEFVTMTNTGAPEQALVQGLVDVTASHSPIWHVTLQAGGVRRLASSWDIFQDPAAGFACRSLADAFVAEHPDIVQGYVNAEYRARVFIASNLEYAQRIVGEFLNLNPSELVSNDYCQEKNINPAYVETWIALAKDMGIIPADAEINLDDIIENSFVPADVPASDAEIGK
jgi:ABC-type nitrate/sulfonate/bicarbonate transport system substrate-binding protein